MARSASRKLLDELPSPAEMEHTIRALGSVEDRALAMLSVAYLDYALELYLKSRFSYAILVG